MSDLGTWRAGLRAALYRLRNYLPGGLGWASNHSVPLLTGLVLQAIFNRITGPRPAYDQALLLVGALVGVEALRAGTWYFAMTMWPGWWQAVATWLRGNALEAIVVTAGPVAGRLPGSGGEAVGRLRDDVEDVIWFVDIWVDLVGGLFFTAAALLIMLSLSPTMTLVVALPLVVVIVAARGLSAAVRRLHRRMREEGSSVTSLIADMFAGILVLKTTGAEERMLDRLQQRVTSRRDAAILAQLFSDLLSGVGGMSVDLSVGLVLLLAAGAMQQGSFTVGDLVLFATYAEYLTGFPRWLGRLMARQREASVAMDRLARMQPRRTVREAFKPGPIFFKGSPPPPAPPVSADAEPFLRLSVENLTAIHPSSGSGVTDVNLDALAGRMTVVTGAIGSGKTTLLRALLGLMPIEAGTLRWNGHAVPDPSTELVPPKVAYIGQVPRLFSASLSENIQLGWAAGAEQMQFAIALAQLVDEVAEMPAGLDTVIGARGSRLSGGQLQRTSIARAVVRSPQLLILDDISSALDVRTEEALWEALVAAQTTILAASHRRAALRRADHIVVLDRGRVVGAGSFAELIETNSEFQRLWNAETAAVGSAS